MSTPSSNTPSSDVLAAHGWDAHWARLAGGAPAGRVTRVDRGLVDVVTATGPVRLPAIDAAVGDWVVLPAQADRPATVMPRRTQLTRAAASGRSEAQVLAANVDTVVVAVAQDTALRPGRTERLLALAWESGAVPVVVLTKADHEPAAVAGALAELAVAAPGAEVLAVSSRTGAGLWTSCGRSRTARWSSSVPPGPARRRSPMRCSARIGSPSAPCAQPTARGATPPRTASSSPCPAVACCRHPGLRGVGLADAAEGVERAFADVVALAEGCRFADCAHDREPGCAMGAAARTDARVAGERKDQARALSRAQRAMYRDRGRR